jgi:hypothetical protein
LEALAVIWAPVRSLARAVEEQWVLLGFGVVALYAALQLATAVVGVATVPLVILSVIELPATGLQAVVDPESAAAAIVDLLLLLLALAAYAWNIVLVVIGAAFARRIGYGESAGSCAISCAGCVGLILTVGLVFGALIAILLQVAGSAGAP